MRVLLESVTGAPSRFTFHELPSITFFVIALSLSGLCLLVCGQLQRQAVGVEQDLDKEALMEEDA